MGRRKSLASLTASAHAANTRQRLLDRGGLRVDLKLAPEDAETARRLMADRGVTLTALVTQLMREAAGG